MPETDLTKALSECYEAAKSGYKLASNEKAVLDSILNSAKDEIRDTAIEYKTSPCEVIGIGETLEDQLGEIQQSADNLRLSFEEDLEILKNDLEKFSITLFGRTMAGKSTLMEVLTEGDGSAIGMGAQRTTRDIRKYEWNGLSVTDVPGIGAFEGEEDTRLAFDAAKTADLIVFLLTDDAPQAVEADCFRQVKDLGKPVIIIMNVKVSIDGNKSMKLISRDMNRAFDEERIEEIRKQFCKFGESYGQDWNSVPFVATHLKAAYEAVKCSKASDEDIKQQEALWREVSRIDLLKELLCEAVQVRGKYIRVKTFADIIANPMIEAISELDLQSRMNTTQGRIVSDKKRALQKRKDSFVKEGNQRIESFMMRLKTELRADIASFAEDHYNDKLADIEWGKVIESKDLEGRCRELLDDMESEVDGIIAETIREMESELRYVSIDSIERSFLTPALIDAKRIVGWTSLLLGGGGTVAAAILTLTGVEIAAGPVGWIAAGIGLAGGIGLLFLESRGDKLAKARARLEKELTESVNATCDSIWTQLEKNLDRLIEGKIDLVLNELTKIETVMESLANTQDELADSLREELRSLNMTFTGKIASAVFGEEDNNYMSNIVTSARIPGVCTLLVETEKGAVSDDFRTRLSDLISEDIRFVTAGEDKAQFASEVLDGMVSPENISYENENEMLMINTDENDIRIYNNLRLLEQFASYKIGG
ncbi:50S ribosome-binding GTPase [Ruminococcaceae bacterium YAD3003]|nr:50S ribosome-binding GTPase [Ruminococcaceae bacterium YAD3003]